MEKARTRIKHWKTWLLYLWKSKTVWLRALLPLAISTVLLFMDENTNYDMRFRIRGQQKPNNNIVLLEIHQSEWVDFHGRSRNLIRPLKEITSLTDSFFWNERTWHLLLTRLLKQDPKQIGISFFFGQNLRHRSDKYFYPKVFSDDRVVWSTSQDNEGRALFLPFTRNFSKKTGLNYLRTDEDGVIRRFSSSLTQVPHLSQRLAHSLAKQQGSKIEFTSDQNYLINFQGKIGAYSRIHFRDFLNGRYPKSFFRGKTVIIGSGDTQSHLYRTPVGELSRAEVMAHITDNLVGNRWIKQPAKGWIVLYLLGLLIVSTWILFAYPQSTAFLFVFGLGTTITALSLWVFDVFYFWIPIQAVLVQLFTTYIIFLSYHLTVNENLNWRLEQEKKYLTEVEEMKNNFVSLFSHDLKTPIAKIQAICDRLLTQYTQASLQKDLGALRRESSELHKYIQKILQITRVESKEFKINKEASDINELIMAVIKQLRPLAKHKRIQLETRLEPMFLIEIDSLLVREVILNLVENAIRYTPEGGTVTTLSHEDEDMVNVVVQDTGVGISSREQGRIFDKFVRGQQHELHTKGTGLGLYLVKYFIELHGGRVQVESELGKGTRFEFSLPIDSGNQEEKIIDLPAQLIPGEI